MLAITTSIPMDGLIKIMLKTTIAKERMIFIPSLFLIRMVVFKAQWNVLNGKVESNPDYYYNEFKKDQKFGSERRRYFEECVMDTESFNYAKNNDEDKAKTHTKLDIAPPPKHDHKLKKNIGDGWNDPTDNKDKRVKNKNNKYNYNSDKE